MDKAAIRAAAVYDLGARLDDALEAARVRVAESRGAVTAFGTGAKAVAALSVHVDRELEEGVLDLEAAALAKKWLARAMGSLENLGRSAENRVLLAEGEARAWETSVGLARKAHESELAKAPAVRPVAADERAPEARRPSVKQRRLAEAAAPPAKKAAKKKTKKKATRKKAARKAG